MDISKKQFFKGKSFNDILEEIYDNSRKKEKKINDLINDLKPMIKEPGDAVMLVPLLKEYLEMGIKNDEHLIKMAGIIQRAMMNNGDDSTKTLSLNENEKEELYKSVMQIKSN